MKFVKIGDGNCKTQMRVKSTDLKMENVVHSAVYYVRPESISYVTKVYKEGSLHFYFYFLNGSGSCHTLVCFPVSEEYEKYVEKVILRQEPVADVDQLAAISGHLETLLVAANKREVTDEPLF